VLRQRADLIVRFLRQLEKILLRGCSMLSKRNLA
jgi:hypothetical protein